MKTKLLALIALLLSLACISASAQAVNNRTVTWPAQPASAGIAGYRLYCGITTNDPATFAAAPVKDLATPAATSMPVALADNITYCAMKVYAVGGLEGPFSNVVSVKAPGALIIQITSIDIDTFGFNAATGTWDKLSHTRDVQVALVSP